MEEEKVEYRKIAVFDGGNFNNWKFRTEILFREYGINKFLTKTIDEFDELIEVDGETAAARTERLKKIELFEKKERKCHSLLIQAIGDKYLEYVKDKENPKEVWSALGEVFERKGMSNRMHLRRKLLTIKMASNDDLQNHLLMFDGLVRELKSAGGKIEEEDIICQLLSSLPKSFDSVSTALETLPIDKLSLDFVKGRLLDASIKFNSNNEQDERLPSSAFVTTSRKSITCFNCGQKGHYKNECQKLSTSSENENLQCSKCKHGTANVARMAAAESESDDEVAIQF